MEVGINDEKSTYESHEEAIERYKKIKMVNVKL